MAEQNQARQPAQIVKISELLEGNYVKEEGWTPNYILTKNKRSVSRVNLLCVIVSISENQAQGYKEFIIDDGSAEIPVRCFEEKFQLNALGVGNIVAVIGRPRQFGEEKYVVPETIKKIENPTWTKVRQLELKLISIKEGKTTEKIEETPQTKEKPEIKTPKEEIRQETKVVEAPKTQEEPSQPTTSYEKIINTIKTLDTGDGADYERVLNKTDLEDSEKIITTLLQEGDIFELRPGKLKVLE